MLARLLAFFRRWAMRYVSRDPAQTECFRMHPEEHLKEMRADIREVVHENRNLAAKAQWETRRAIKASHSATRAAHDLITKLETGRGARDSNAVPPN